MAKLIEPLAPNVPIVDPETGNPTPYFARILRDLSDARFADSIVDALGGDPDENAVVTWDDAAGDLAFVPNDELLELNDLTDVDTVTTPPEDGQALVWVDADSEWAPGDVASGGGGGGYDGGPPGTVPAVGDLTWVNQGTATATNGVNGIVFGNDVDGEVHMLVATAPTAPYDVYARVEAFPLSSSANTTDIFDDFGLVLRDSTNADFLFIHFRCRRISGDEQNEYSVMCSRYTNPTTFSATAFQRFQLKSLKWIRVNVTSTTVTVYVSENGLDWISVATETIATFVGSVTQYGIGMRSSTTTSSSMLVTYFSTDAPVLSTSGGSGTDAYRLIEEQIPAGGATSVTFASIPDDYRDLVLVFRGRGDTAATTTTISAVFNNDTGANYHRQRVGGNNTTVSATVSTENNAVMGVVPAATASASFPGYCEHIIYDYAGVNFFKNWGGSYHGRQGTALSNTNTNLLAGTWADTSAITEIDVVLSAGGFVAGTVVSLYGRL